MINAKKLSGRTPVLAAPVVPAKADALSASLIGAIAYAAGKAHKASDVPVTFKRRRALAQA